MDKFLGFKTEEILTCLLLFAVGYAIAKMFSGCGCNDGFSVGGKKRNKQKLKFTPSTKVELRDAIRLWTSNQDEARETYGDIKGWDTSEITDMYALFRQNMSFNEDISGWDVSSVTDMSGMFYFAEAFNKPLNRWNVGSVRDMNDMFHHANTFDQDISGWDVSSVTDMFNMFNYAIRFDQDISGWDVSSVTDMSWMFTNTKAFNQDLNCWEVDIDSVNIDNMFRSSYMEYGNPITNGCWNIKSDNYIGCRTDCNSPAPPPPAPPAPAPPAPPAPAPTPTPTPTPTPPPTPTPTPPPAPTPTPPPTPTPTPPPAPQAFCDPRGARPQLCPGQIPCPQCGKSKCPCPFYNFYNE